MLPPLPPGPILYLKHTQRTKKCYMFPARSSCFPDTHVPPLSLAMKVVFKKGAEYEEKEKKISSVFRHEEKEKKGRTYFHTKSAVKS